MTTGNKKSILKKIHERIIDVDKISLEVESLIGDIRNEAIDLKETNRQLLKARDHAVQASNEDLKRRRKAEHEVLALRDAARGSGRLTVVGMVGGAYANAFAKGWHDDAMNIPEKIALIHSEASEALEEYRKPEFDPAQWWMEKDKSGENKPEGFPIELADIVIRVGDLCGALDIDLEEAIQVKMDYNKTRPHRHGGKRA